MNAASLVASIRSSCFPADSSCSLPPPPPRPDDDDDDDGESSVVLVARPKTSRKPPSTARSAAAGRDDENRFEKGESNLPPEQGQTAASKALAEDLELEQEQLAPPPEPEPPLDPVGHYQDLIKAVYT